MARIHRDEKQLILKLLLLGAEGSGKRSTLRQLHTGLPGELRGPMRVSEAALEDTHFFEVEVPDAGLLPGYRTFLQIVTVPGEIRYRATMALLLRGADGLVFVVDSRPEKHPDNARAWQQMHDALKDEGLKVSDVGLVLQYNKADLPEAVPQQVLDNFYNRGREALASHAASAKVGTNLVAVLGSVSEHAISRLLRQLQPPEVEPGSTTQDGEVFTEVVSHACALRHSNPMAVTA